MELSCQSYGMPTARRIRTSHIHQDYQYTPWHNPQSTYPVGSLDHSPLFRKIFRRVASFQSTLPQHTFQPEQSRLASLSSICKRHRHILRIRQ